MPGVLCLTHRRAERLFVLPPQVDDRSDRACCRKQRNQLHTSPLPTLMLPSSSHGTVHLEPPGANWGGVVSDDETRDNRSVRDVAGSPSGGFGERMEKSVPGAPDIAGEAQCFSSGQRGENIRCPVVRNRTGGLTLRGHRQPSPILPTGLSPRPSRGVRSRVLETLIRSRE